MVVYRAGDFQDGWVCIASSERPPSFSGVTTARRSVGGGRVPQLRWRGDARDAAMRGERQDTHHLVQLVIGMPHNILYIGALHVQVEIPMYMVFVR